jgi:hypothetical protein
VCARTLQLWLLQATMTHALDVLTSVRCVRESALDRTAADVWHYAHALAGDASAPPALRAAAEQILDRAETICLEAAAGGPLHLVGHSLGSVVASHVMTRRLPPDAVTHLVTLGSPLEKVRFISAALFPSTESLPRTWSNYFTPSDPVSGSLKRFATTPDRPIRNIRCWGLGGYGLAHVGYFRDTRVACDIARGLGAEVDPQSHAPRSGWLQRRILDVAVPGGTLLLVGVGLNAAVVMFGAAIWLTGAFMGLLASAWSAEAGALVERGWWMFLGAAAPVLWIVLTTKDGYRSAARQHARYWRSHCVAR